MTNFIGNYALMYAINTLINDVHRNASGTKPFYEEDLKRFKLYATPAKPLIVSDVPFSFTKLRWNRWERVSHTFNSVYTLLQTTESSRKPNLPQIGSKEKFAPLNTFEFFVIGGAPPSLIRLGKKHAACRVHAYPLTLVKKSDSEFFVDHPVNPMDVSSFEQKIVRGDYQLQFPPLVLNAKLRAEHYVLKQEEKTYYVLKPSPEIYPSVNLP
ncbi:type I-D CRISPR-associated protein Cas5/Csc1 [Candidatus Marsarchaeota G1 archaeon OSP_B]|jgi:CRISPR type I-D-associated protein Csc1|nr:MAG: type I-D CRISPR-associated protein Cas5/Csc1 [Candidatus Marsarchaeota G1 archaeon OSP_B]